MTDETLNGHYQITRNVGAREWTKVGTGTIPPENFTSQIVNTTGFTFPSTWATANLETTDIDGSGSEYTIDLANDRIEFDDTDGNRVYKVTLTGKITFNSKTAASGIRADLDGTTSDIYVKQQLPDH